MLVMTEVLPVQHLISAQHVLENSLLKESEALKQLDELSREVHLRRMCLGNRIISIDTVEFSISKQDNYDVCRRRHSTNRSAHSGMRSKKRLHSSTMDPIAYYDKSMWIDAHGVLKRRTDDVECSTETTRMELMIYHLPKPPPKKKRRQQQLTSVKDKVITKPKPDADGQIRIGASYQVANLPQPGSYEKSKVDDGEIIFDPQKAAAAEAQGEDIGQYMIQGENFYGTMLLLEALHRADYSTKRAMQEYGYMLGENPSLSVSTDKRHQKSLKSTSGKRYDMKRIKKSFMK